jgi:hypothetical protein
MLGNISPGVLLQVELASLPWDTSQNSSFGCSKTFVIITDYQLHATHATIFETLEKGSPMDFMLTKRGRNP